jgi:hypothetical protein
LLFFAGDVISRGTVLHPDTCKEVTVSPPKALKSLVLPHDFKMDINGFKQFKTEGTNTFPQMGLIVSITDDLKAMSRHYTMDITKIWPGPNAKPQGYYYYELTVGGQIKRYYLTVGQSNYGYCELDVDYRNVGSLPDVTSVKLIQYR